MAIEQLPPCDGGNARVSLFRGLNSDSNGKSTHEQKEKRTKHIAMCSLGLRKLEDAVHVRDFSVAVSKRANII